MVLGVVLIVLGLIPPVHAFIQFVKAGGTPMPVAPTERLVVTGFNRFVRNPMYVGLLTAILGQALLFDSIWLVALRGDRLDRHSVIRALVRGADPRPDVRRAVRGVPPQCACVDSAPHAMESAASEGWWFVVGGEPGLALSFFFGDEFGSLASFGVDAVAAVLFAGLFAARHHRRRDRGGFDRASVSGSSPVDWASAGNMLAPWGSVA